ncbi:MAG: hypothetical protein QOI80_136, partial [Solirubrobacteraceae bacterium]|nr:hypothetical protein [Solirubrobacteraceae bacterium]
GGPAPTPPGPVVGDLTLDAARTHVPVSHVDLGVDVPVSSAGGGGGSVGRADFGPLHVTVPLDATVATRIGDVKAGRRFPTLTVRLTGPDHTYQLRDLQVVGAEVTAGDGKGGRVELSFLYTDIQETTHGGNAFCWTPTTVKQCPTS